jgi:Holliday junction resolvase RusA-like endonuclease
MQELIVIVIKKVYFIVKTTLLAYLDVVGMHQNLISTTSLAVNKIRISTLKIITVFGLREDATMKLTIPGDVPSQKNRKIISVNRATGRPFLRSAPAVKNWQEIALQYLTKQFRDFRMTNYPIDLTVVVYYGNKRRHDLDNALGTIMDALTAAKIIEDDSTAYVECVTIQFGGYDKTNPRAEIYFDE